MRPRNTLTSRSRKLNQQIQFTYSKTLYNHLTTAQVGHAVSKALKRFQMQSVDSIDYRKLGIVRRQKLRFNAINWDDETDKLLRRYLSRYDQALKMAAANEDKGRPGTSTLAKADRDLLEKLRQWINQELAFDVESPYPLIRKQSPLIYALAMIGR